MPQCRERPPRQDAPGKAPSAALETERTHEPPEPSHTVGLFHDRIVTTVAIGFTLDDQPDSAAAPMLDALAAILKDNPTLELVEIAVHLPKAGPDWRARRVSSSRASAVSKELARRGVEKPRLVAQGYGFLCPVSAASPAELARAESSPPLDTSGLFASAVKNSAARLSEASASERVEFIVLRRDGKPTREQRGCSGSERARPKLEQPSFGGANDRG